MRQYLFVIYKGNKVSCGFNTKEEAVSWARKHYDLADIEFVQFWD